MIFVATKKGRTNIIFPSSFGAVVVSGIRDPGWIKIRIRDKHSGSTTMHWTRVASSHDL
jgi:hypothetical protein